MADQDELRLRIVPELDRDAVKQVEEDLSKISGNVPVGGTSGTGGAEANARKQRLADYRAEIDLIDLSLRKTTAASQRRTQLLEQEAAAGKRSLQETAQLIAQEENLRESATAEAIRGYELLEQELAQLGSSQQDVINRQKQLFFASERAKNGFTTMSGSMTQLTSSTKDANIAFANFGRIVQDAPFGLLGISNNIDPLLNSFAQLKASTGGTAAALAAMGRQLLGPAGLIFLLGSALPTALLFAQKYMRDMKKEAEDTNDVLDDTIEQFARLAAKAAAGQGARQIEVELGLARDELGRLTKEYENLAEYRRGGYVDAEKEAILTSIEGEKKIAQAVIDRLNTELTEAKVQQSIQNLRERGAVAESLRIDESIEKRNKDREQRQREADDEAKRIARIAEQRASLEQSLSKIFDDELTQRIKAEQAYVRELLANDQLTGQERIALQEYYNGIASRLTQQFQDEQARIEAEGQKKRLEQERKFLEQKNKDRQQKEAGLIRLEREMNAIKGMMAQDTIALLRARGNELLSIDLELGLERKRIEEDYREARRNGLIEAELLDQAEANAIAEAEIAAEKKKANAIAEMSNMAANAIVGGMSAVFGRSKGIKAAEVAIQSITAAYEAFSSVSAKFAAFPGVGSALGAAAAAGILAQGRKSISEIYATKPGTRGAGGTPSAQSASFGQSPSFVNDLGAANMVAGTITPFGASMSPSISITANLDRQGLALAVRDGEADIATRQIPFAS